MGDYAPISYWYNLDALDAEKAVYVGPNGSSATIDRAAFDSQGKPLRITVTIGDVPHPEAPAPSPPIGEDPK